MTGDYSVGATGFLIENGEFKYPINEITIAGNFKDMFQNITLANDLEFKYATNSPTMLIEGMVVAGKCCLLYTSPSPRDALTSRMPSSA